MKPVNVDKYSQNVATVVINHGSIVKNPQRISKFKPFTKQYSCEKIKFWKGLN